MVNEVKSPGKLKLAFTILIGAGLVWMTFSLGQWQTSRAQQKQALFDVQARALEAAPVSPNQAQLDLDNMSYRKIELTGRFNDKALIYIDNRQVNGRPAVQVVQGFQPEGSTFLIPVDRGYLLRDPADPRLAPSMPADVAYGNESFELKGTILPKFAQSAELRGVQLGSEKDIYRSESNGYQVWSNFNADEFEKQAGQPVGNFVVTLQPVAQGAEVAAGATVVNGFYHMPVPLQEQVAKHKGYAFQWFAMSGVLVFLTLFFVYREFFKGNRL